MRYADKDDLEIQSLALTLVQSVAAIYQEAPEWRGVSSDHIPLTIAGYYEEATANLSRTHFRVLGDAENLASSRRTVYARSIVRFLVSDDGGTLAAIGFHRPATPGANVIADLSFVTEVRNEILVTSNGRGRTDRIRPAGVKLVESAESSLVGIAEIHARRVRQAWRVRDDRPKLYHRLVDAISAMERLHARVAEYRESIGWVEQKEIVAMFKRRLPGSVIGKLWAAVKELRKPVSNETAPEVVEELVEACSD